MTALAQCTNYANCTNCANYAYYAYHAYHARCLAYYLRYYRTGP